MRLHSNDAPPCAPPGTAIVIVVDGAVRSQAPGGYDESVCKGALSFCLVGRVRSLTRGSP